MHQLHFRDHFPYPLPHMTASMVLIMVHYVVVVFLFVERMIGGMAHFMDVSLGGEISHIICIACSNGSMREHMATTTKHLFPFEVSHMIDWIPYGGDYQLITYEMIWDNMFHNVGEEILGGLVFIFPLEGNIVAAQYQHILCTYPEWRGGQHGVGYFVYQDHIFSPSILQEPKVVGDFQELPCWEVTHFVWMIAWGMEDPLGEDVPQHILDSIP